MTATHVNWKGFSDSSLVFTGDYGMCRYDFIYSDDTVYKVAVDYETIAIGDEKLVYERWVPTRAGNRYIDKHTRSVLQADEVDQAPLERFIREFVKHLNVNTPSIYIAVCRNPQTVMLELIINPAKLLSEEGGK